MPAGRGDQHPLSILLLERKELFAFAENNPHAVWTESKHTSRWTEKKKEGGWKRG